MPARKIVRQATRYEIDTRDLADMLEVPEHLEIVSVTFHNGILRVFTVTKENVTPIRQNVESQNDSQTGIPRRP